MNKTRRADLESLKKKLAEEIKENLLGINGELDEFISEIESVRDEEQDAYDAMPEGVQDSERGSRMLEAIGHMEDAIGEVELLQQHIEVTAKEWFNDALDALEQAKMLKK